MNKMDLTQKKIKISVNQNLINKVQPKNKKHLSNGFDPYELLLEEFQEVISEGYCFSYQFKNHHRKKENFLCTDIICVDMDGGRELEDTLKDSIVKQYGSLYYTTPSHSPDHHRFRIVFVLPHTLTDVEEVKSATRSLAMRLGDDPIGKWFYEILKSSGHYYTDTLSGDTRFKGWKEDDTNKFYRERFDLHKSYVNFMSEEYPHERKSTSIGDLTSGLKRLNDRGLIQFSSVRVDPKKHGDSMSYRFGSLNELKKLFVNKIFDGDEIMAWGETEEDFPDEDGTTTSSEQKEMFDMFKKSSDLLKQRFGKSGTEGWTFE